MRKEKEIEIRNNIKKLKTTKLTEIDEKNSFLKIKKYKCTIGERDIYREKLIKGKSDGSAVTIIPLLDNGELLMVMEPRVFTNKTVGIGFPAGYIEESEDENEAALRELKEETGYVADEIIKLDEFYQDEGCSGALNKIFVARNCKKKYAQKLDEDEIVEYITLTFEEIKELLNNKYIMGGHTKLAIEKYKEFITK